MLNNPKNYFDIEAVLRGEQSFDVVGDILVRKIENEAVLLHITTGTYLTLSETSIPFWEAIQKKQPLELAVNQIINEYEVEKSQVIEELNIFVKDLLQFKIICNSLNT